MKKTVAPRGDKQSKKTPAHSKKTTKSDGALRVQEIKKAIIQGFTRSDIILYCKQKWGVTSLKTVYKYFNAACDEIREDGKAEIEDHRAEQVARLKDVLRQLSGSLYRDEVIRDNDGDRIPGPDGAAKTQKVPRDTTMRFYLMTVRHLSRITGIETIRIDDPNRIPIDDLRKLFEDLERQRQDVDG